MKKTIFALLFSAMLMSALAGCNCGGNEVKGTGTAAGRAAGTSTHVTTATATEGGMYENRNTIDGTPNGADTIDGVR